jgi:hypothetical protein
MTWLEVKLVGQVSAFEWVERGLGVFNDGIHPITDTDFFK